MESPWVFLECSSVVSLLQIPLFAEVQIEHLNEIYIMIDHDDINSSLDVILNRFADGVSDISSELNSFEWFCERGKSILKQIRPSEKSQILYNILSAEAVTKNLSDGVTLILSMLEKFAATTQLVSSLNLYLKLLQSELMKTK